MAVVTVESAMENVLEEAGALPRHCRIALNRLKVTIRTVAEEDLDLPLTLGIVGVAVRIDFCSEIVNSGAFAFGVLCLLQIEQRRSCHRGTRFQQHLFGCLIQVQDRASASAFHGSWDIAPGGSVRHPLCCSKSSIPKPGSVPCPTPGRSRRRSRVVSSESVGLS